LADLAADTVIDCRYSEFAHYWPTRRLPRT